jgi:hypothetical protein
VQKLKQIEQKKNFPAIVNDDPKDVDDDAFNARVKDPWLEQNMYTTDGKGTTIQK